MKKKFALLLLGCTLALSLMGCSNKPQTPKPAGEAVTETENDTEVPAETSSPEEESEAAPAETESEAVSETEAETEAPAETASQYPFEGNWYEPIAGRGYVTAVKEGDVYKFNISWPGSAATMYLWSFSGTPDEEGVIAYTDCTKIEDTWDEEDNEISNTLEENACGKIWINEEGRLLWLEHETDEEPSEFVKEQ